MFINFKSNKLFFFKVVKKFVESDVVNGHLFHWICCICILIVSFLGSIYQIYHAVRDLSKNISDIDITYPTNFSVPSVTICFPILALLSTECLSRKNPKAIQKFEQKFPKRKGKHLLKELYKETIKTERDSRLILNEFYLNELYTCLDKPMIETTNNSFTVLRLDDIEESFKGDLFCNTLNFDSAFVDKKVLLKKRIMKSFFDLNLIPSQLEYVDYVKLFLHDAADTQNDYLLWYYKLIKFDFEDKEYKNIFGFTYLHFSNVQEEKCIKNGQITYHYTEEKFSTTSHMEEDCINRDFISILRYPFGDTRLPIKFIFENPKLKLKLYKPDKPTFDKLNVRYNFSRRVDSCFKIKMKEKACRTSIFVPELKYTFRRESKDMYIKFLLIPPGEPDLEVKSAPRLSTFEFGIFLTGVICCWLQFSLFGFVYSIIMIRKNLKEIESKLQEEDAIAIKNR